MESPEAPIFTGTLPPVRGIVPTHNKKGKPFSHGDIHRWVRLVCGLHKVKKIDLLVHDAIPHDIGRLIAAGQRGPTTSFGDALPPLGVPISLRTNVEQPPEDFDELVRLGLFDVFLTLTGAPVAAIEQWGAACAAHGRDMRIQLSPPFPADWDVEALAEAMAQRPVKMVNIVLDDPFMPPPRRMNKAEAARFIQQVNHLATACRERSIEVNLFGMPVCLLDGANRDVAGGMGRFFLDHQQYHRESYALAAFYMGRHPRMVRLLLTAMLAHHAELRSFPDEFLLRWLVLESHTILYAGISLMFKLVRFFGLLPRTARAIENPQDQYMLRLIEDITKDRGASKHPACAACSRRYACDQYTGTVRRMLPGLEPEAIAGAVIPSPRKLLRQQDKHFDAVDYERLHEDDDLAALAQDANRIMADSPPNIDFGLDDIQPVNAVFHRMPGAYRYMALTDRELVSSYLYAGEPPFTIAATFGGGLADAIGFTVNDTIRILCPMEASSHTLALHCDEDGRYVLLRDRIPVRPVELEGIHLLPRRLPSIAHVRLCMRNVDNQLTIQNPLVWKGEQTHTVHADWVKYSVVLVCTRYARRLQATLQSIAHQEGIDPENMEVIVGYVPAIDATDDLITSMRLVHPRMRFLRSPFPENQTFSKGAIINQSVTLASGEWIVILDADILLPPRLFRDLDDLDEGCMFAAPDGRKMLPRDVTAEILLGEKRSWECWEELVAGPGECRAGKEREGGDYPIGFCQLVRRSCFEKVRYNEYGHFQGADYEFGVELAQHFGPCTWLDVLALHLDHGGSQWYGARGHM